ncbi:MAG TPA: arginine--tRNA ligase [Bacillota bacterium]|nr:arginine--tRNA ligase [Bacillota bacterium]
MKMGAVPVIFEVERELRAALQRAAERAGWAGMAAAATVEVPRDPAHGDFASNLALAMAGRLGKPPRRIAETLAEQFEIRGTRVRCLEVAGPGFLNFRLHPTWLGEAVHQALDQEGAYGRSDAGGGQRVLVEFVSANPTGPLVLVAARAAAVGDVLASALEWSGHRAEREYYVNDAGRQVELLAESLEARLRQQRGEPAAIPDGGYPGEYLVDLAAEALRDLGASVLESPDRRDRLREYAVERMVASHRAELAAYGVHFATWFREAAFRTGGRVAEVLDLLERGGASYEREGARWFASRRYGDDKDRVLIKSDGEYTYLLPDAAYHLDKLRRGHERLINLWGPDHHGYIPRMQAVLQALGYPPGTLEVLIVQWVRLLRGGDPVRLSKRGGVTILMRDLLEEAGTDAARFFFLLRSHDSPMDFDLDLAKLKAAENPVYYVQYAHARIAGILREAERRASAPDPSRLETLSDPAELVLARKLADLPAEVLTAAQLREVHRLTRYATDLATLFHKFYDTCRVLGDDPKVTGTRLALVQAARIALGNTLRLLGVSAPERM